MSAFELAAARGHAEALLRRGEASAAANAARQAVRDAPASARPVEVAWTRLVLARAEWMRGRVAAAQQALDDVAGVRGTGHDPTDPQWDQLARDVFEFEMRCLAEPGALAGEQAMNWVDAAVARWPAEGSEAACLRVARRILDARDRADAGEPAAALDRAEAAAAELLERLPDSPGWIITWLTCAAAAVQIGGLLTLDRVDEATALVAQADAAFDAAGDDASLEARILVADAMSTHLDRRATAAGWRETAKRAEYALNAMGKSLPGHQMSVLKALFVAPSTDPSQQFIRSASHLRSLEVERAWAIRRAIDAGWGERLGDRLSAISKADFGLWLAIERCTVPIQTVLGTVMLVLMVGGPFGGRHIGASWSTIALGWAAVVIATGILSVTLVPWWAGRRASRIDPLGDPPTKTRGTIKELGDIEQTVRDLPDALSRGSTVVLLEHTGRLWTALGDADRAIGCAEDVLTHHERHGMTARVADTAEWLAELHRAAERPRAALFYAALAVAHRQRTAVRLRAASARDGAGFLHRHRTAFVLLADLLLDAGRILDAERVMDLLKADELHTFTRAFTAAEPPALDPEDAAWMARYRTSADALQQAEQQHERALRREREADAPDPTALSAAARALIRHRDAFRTLQSTLVDALGAGAVARRAADLEEAVRAVPEGVVVVQFIVARRRLHLIVRHGTAAPVHAVDTRAADEPDWTETLTRHVVAVRETVLARRHTRHDPTAKALAEHLLPPDVRRMLAEAAPATVLFALDGPLRYLPLAALPHPDDGRYLVEHWPIALYTLAAHTALNRTPTAAWRASAFGVTRAHPGFSPLPEVSDELRAVLGAFDEPEPPKLDEAFTVDAFADGLGSGRPLVHCATHFALDPHRAAESGLLLGTGDLLTLQTLADDPDGRFGFAHVDLLTLSACETAFGADTTGDGREVESLGVIAQRKGAQSVLASLWKVSDGGTAALMKGFYCALADRRDKAHALQRAQLALLHPPDTRPDDRSGGASFSLLGTPLHDAPWFWAGFVLMGHWR